MRNIKYIFVALLFFVSFSFVKAETCDSDDIKRLKEIANNVNVGYSYNEDYENDGNYGFFNINISGITNEIYGDMFLSENYEMFYYYDDDNLGTFEEVGESGPKTLYVYSKNCDNTLLKKIKIEVPYYNIYSTYEECDGISEDDLEVCSKFLDKEITYSVFINAINKYNNNIDDAVDKSFFSKYKYVIFGCVFVVVIVALFIIFRKIKSRNELK